jgi:hypothetical protein
MQEKNKLKLISQCIMGFSTLLAKLELIAKNEEERCFLRTIFAYLNKRFKIRNSGYLTESKDNLTTRRV